MNSIWRGGAVLAFAFLTACGGGSLGDGSTTGGGLGGSTTGGGTTGGSTGSGIAATLTLSASSSEVAADGSSSALMMATLTDTTSQPIAGKTLNFSTNAGTLSATSAETDSNGQASVYLRASTQVGTATVRVSEPDSGLSNSSNVSFTAGSAAGVTLLVAPTQVALGGTASVNIQISDAHGNPVSGVAATLSITTNSSGGLFTATQVVSDDNGRASTTYKAGTTTGTDVLKATLAGGQSSSASVTVSASTSAIGSISLSLGASSASISPSPLDSGTAIKTAAIAIVNDSAGVPMPGQTVVFSTSAGKLQSGSGTPGVTVTAVTNAQGVAQVFQLSPTEVGAATITAATGGFSQSQSMTFTAGAPNSITLVLSPTAVGPGQLSGVTATLLDGNGNPASGVMVNFSVPTNASGGSLAQTTVPTDTNGRAQTTYTAGGGTGTDTIRASVATAGVSPATASLQVAVQVGNLTLTALNSTVIASSSNSTTVTATLVDANGLPIRGQAVCFATSAGTLAAAACNGSAKTGADGKVSLVLTAPNTVGDATITANVPGSTAATVVQFIAGPANTLVLSTSPTTVAPGGSSTLFANVADSHGNPVSGVSVRFSGTGSGSINPALATTDAVGQARTVYTAGDTSATITADVGNGVNDTATISVSATTALVGSLNLSLGASSVAAGFPAGVTLSALVLDTDGNPVAAKTVTFNVSDGTLDADATPTTATAVTNSSGIARVKLSPPTHTMPTLIARAEADGFTDEGTLSVVPGAASAAASSITANPSALLANGTSTSTLTVVLNDANGNALPDGTSVILQSTKGTLATNTALLSSGRAVFTLTAPTTSGTGTVSVPAVSGLSTGVTFTGATTGDPASLRFTATATQIYVAGVGQNQQSAITVTVLDSAGNPIDESKYGDATLDNLQARFITRPNGGETLSGTTAAGAIATNDASGVLNVRTTNGVATLTLQSGTISGIVEVQFSVQNFAASGIAASGLLPQVSIASGAPATIVFTGPITNAIENLANGNYRLHGKVDVRDRYGNFVPDGTVVNFALIDSAIIQDNTGTTSANSSVLSRSGNSLINRRCATQPAPGGEATSCNAKGSNTASSDFLSTITRNDNMRGIQDGDLILLRDTQDSDKRRSVSGTPSSGVQLSAQSNYLKSVSNAMFWAGSALSGAAISGLDQNSALTPGTGVVKGGLAEFRVDYPANVRSILTGCYGYKANGSYNDIDLRDAVPQSRQVVVSADAGGKASAINAGDFCFKAIAGGTLTPSSDTILLGSGESAVVTLSLRDGGDTVPLPYVPLSCFVTSIGTPPLTVQSAIVGVDTDGDRSTRVDGTGTVTITRAIQSGAGSAVVRCVGGDAATDITVNGQ